MNGGHHLSRRVKGRFSTSGKLCLESGLTERELICPSDESRLGRLTRNLSLLVYLRIRAESHRRSKALFVIAEMVNDCHLILRERTRLIRADYLSAAKRFYRGKTADNGVSLGHIRNADRKNDGNDRGKSLGNSGNRKGYSYHKCVKRKLEVKRAVSHKLNAEHDNADSDNQPGEYLGKLMKLDLKGSFTLLCTAERVCDLAHLGVHSRSGNNGNAASVNYGRAHIEHIFSISEGNFLLALSEIDDIDELTYGN